MPLYEYECPGCGTFERVQKFSDPILKACPTCEKPVEKLLSAPAIQFKGTGWYVTDYAKKGAGSDKGKDEGEKKTKPGAGDKVSSPSKDKPAKKDSSSSSSSKGSSSK